MLGGGLASGSASDGSDVDIDELVRAVIHGGYGNGKARRAALGSNYDTVQARVNEMLGAGGSSDDVNIDALARAVIRGDHGNSEERKCRPGSNYAAVQARANEMLS